MKSSSVESTLGPTGTLANKIPGFIPRQPQIDMALDVSAAIKNKDKLVVEAATGTGKTFAYLIPSLLSGKKIIVSTGTKNLQDQLFQKDLPLLINALKLSVKIALLKGRSNYICLHRLEKYNKDGRFPSREITSHLYKVKLWANQTQYGDVAELTMIPEDSLVWPYVTSTKENCIGQECDFFNKCFVSKARQKALKADLLVINHHLFFADLALKDTGFGELLPGVDAIIFDEAHQLPEIASLFFSTSISSKQLYDVLKDIEIEFINHAVDYKTIAACLINVEKAIVDMRLTFGVDRQRNAWQRIVNKPELQQCVQLINEHIQTLVTYLKPMMGRNKIFENLFERVCLLQQHFKMLTGPTPPEQIHWYEVFSKNFTLTLTPLTIAKPFLDYINKHEKAWIFTSATLSVMDNFDFFVKRMGLDNTKQKLLPQIFNYQSQVKLYIPHSMPQPNAINYVSASVEAAIQVIHASKGRTFFLFTSHDSIKKSYEILKNKIHYPLLVQGMQPKNQLVETYRQLGNAVLLGTYSFWEGVDVKGEALSTVIIDKLPFASPSDPILQARIHALKNEGGDPFLDYQIPHAIINLKQGIGRLIRDANDRGVIMLCDPRLLNKTYGELFLQSMPQMPMTQDIEEVRQFFSSEEII